MNSRRSTLVPAALGLAIAALAVPAAAAQQPPTPASPRRVTAPAAVGAMPAAPDRGWLGVSLERTPWAPQPDGDASPADAPPDGVRIGAVIRDSPADRAGLRGGDLVTTIDGQPIETTEEFIRIVSGRGPGAWLELEVWRRGATRRATVRLERFPEDASRLREVKIGWAGIELVDVPLQLREQWGGSEERGVLVGAVVAQGPAELGGIRPGDLVLEIDGEPVAESVALISAIARAGDGAKVELALSRQGTALTVELLLEVEPPDAAAAADAPPPRNRSEGPGRRPNGR